MTQELKPCPHCGAEAVLTEQEPHDHSPGLVALTGIPAMHPGSWTIECVACSCGMIYATREEVVAAWNRRALATPSPLSDEPVAWTSSARLEKIAKNPAHVDTMWGEALTHDGTDNVPLYAAPLATPSDKQEADGGMSDSPLVIKFRRDCWLRNHAYERAARICEAILAFGFVGDESADRFEWTAKECARMVRSLKDHEEFASKHEEPND
ncbi:hypothetical protein AWB73_00084 [Caballeronia turbans]|nr:hypothetical protein AWB73_00084 [Caballeronia turbans]